MEPQSETLVMFGREMDEAALDWAWVDEHLGEAGTYWLTARSDGHPHPRPVWGVWSEGVFHLSIGSPVLRRQLEADRRITVHLDSSLDVVVVEGVVQGSTADAAVISRYDEKYDWSYDPDAYGPLTVVAAQRVLAWRSAGPAGRDGFQETGRWSYDLSS